MTAQLELFERPAIPCSIGQVQVTAIESLSLLCRGKGRTAAYDYTLNPYRGCSFGCSYCYAPFFDANPERRANWGKWVEVKYRALEALSKTDLCGKRIYMSSVTDPYQPIEAQTGLTREIVGYLAARKSRLVVQTRSPLVTRDIDLLTRFAHVRVNLSITTDSDEVRKQYEPSCASIERRLGAARELKNAGIGVSVCVCPMLPMEDPARFGRLLDEIGVDAAAAGWFHQSDRDLFASNTREIALSLAHRHGWTEDRFRECKAMLKQNCRALTAGAEAFGPA